MEVQLLVILLLTVVAPLWLILHYVTMWKKNRGLSAEEESGFRSMRASADKLDARIATLERILDDEVPDWRQR